MKLIIATLLLSGLALAAANADEDSLDQAAASAGQIVGAFRADQAAKADAAQKSGEPSGPPASKDGEARTKEVFPPWQCFKLSDGVYLCNGKVRACREIGNGFLWCF